MSADKNPSILPRQLETLVFVILQMFFATSSVFGGNWRISLRYSPLLAGACSVMGPV